jgi:exodeoxyribonuclease-3
MIKTTPFEMVFIIRDSMKFVSWNVNGLRACIQKDFLNQFQQLDADFFCLQETKLSEGQLQLDLPGYEQYWCYAEKKGYSGTAIFTKHRPLSVTYGIGVPELDNEGRVITLEYQEFYLVTCYTPNAQRGLARLDHRMNWDEAFRNYLKVLDAVKPVVICGDLNVAHQEIDLKNPASNHKNAGFSDEERQSFQDTLDSGFTDTFRHLYPDVTGRYSWWSYMFNARENNAGWRIDYFLVSDRMQGQIQQADILSHILGSDHCPVTLELDTLVNGAVWSPDAGTPSVIETETTKKKSKKASPVNGKALALSLCLILALVLCVGLIPFGSTHISPDPTSPNDGDNILFTIESHDKFSLVYKTSDNPTSTKRTPYKDRLQSGEEVFFADEFNTGSLYSSNFYLVLRLTDSGKYSFLEGLQSSLKASNSANNTSATPSIQNLSIIPCYTDAEHTEGLGWLVWGYLFYDVTIWFHTGDYGFTTSAFLSHNQYNLGIGDIPTYDNIIHMIPINKPPQIDIQVEDNFYSFSIDGSIFYASNRLNDYEENILNANFWFVISLTRDGTSLLGNDIVSLSYIFSCEPGQNPNINHLPYYSNDKIAGWLVYGNNITEIHQITAGNSNAILTYTDPIKVTPFIQSDQAMQMSTNDLVNSIVHNQYFNEIFVEYSSDKYYTYGYLLQEYPAVLEMHLRSDAGEYLSLYDGNPFADYLYQLWKETYTPVTVMADIFHYDSPIRMTQVKENGKWMTKVTAPEEAYYAELTTILPEDASFVIRVELLGLYIDFLGRNSSLYFTYNSATNFVDVTSVAYYTDSSMTHVAGWFILGSSSVTAIDNLQVGKYTIYPDPIPTNPYVNREDAAKMSTQELVQYIMNHDGILSAINYFDPTLSYDPTGRVIRRYPVLSELMERDDANAYLLAYAETDDVWLSQAATMLFEYWYTSIFEDFTVPVE